MAPHTNTTINELLCFVSAQYDKLDRVNLNAILNDSFSLEDATVAKQILISEAEKIKVSDAINDSTQ